MALSTQCPHCKTVFRVASDQLKLRSGLVRCGSCKQIFNGIENLVPDGTPAPPPAKPIASAPAAAAPTAAPISTASVPGAPAVPVTPPAPPATQSAELVSSPGIDFVSMEPEPAAAAPEPARSASATNSIVAPAVTAADDEEDPLLRMTVMNIVPDEEESSVEEPPAAAEKPADRDDEPTAASTEQTASEEADEEPEKSISDEPVKPALLVPAHEEPETSDTAPVAVEDEEAEEVEDKEVEKEAEEKEPETTAPAPLRRRTQVVEDEEGTEEDEAYEPSFVTHARKRQRRGKILRIFMSFASVILLVGLIAQGAYVFRTQLAARFPQTKPMLAQLCQFAGCQVKLPAQIDMVSIESTELQAVAPNKNVFTLNVLLRNRSTLAQAWPHIELTLNDGNEQPVARRVLPPRDYLPAGQDTAKGFNPNSEQSIKVVFELAQIKASGYRVYLFYP